MIAKESPLKGMDTGTAAAVTIRELPGLHTIDLRVAPGTEAQAAVAEALGIELPGKPGRIRAVQVLGESEAHALCLAPDWWLIVGYQEAVEKLAPLKNGHHFSVVDVSGQRTTIELEGPNAREVLAHLWEQDLREKSFPAGSVSQGLMAKAPVIVCHIAPSRYRVMVRSSFALHLWKALVDAAEEWN
ncbi:sarcosine oxidase subunit gamma [Foetidibacter luteolus]|uniref:sarcosine oxidase subunit gamma n=1 Tax=Foetidibacter luteolus TaxID=2608880 RepID=UPI00129B2D78|nr:sarcosine oxidase subunit gamma family protein [Foetidibacter luteolus]